MEVFPLKCFAIYGIYVASSITRLLLMPGSACSRVLENYTHYVSILGGLGVCPPENFEILDPLRLNLRVFLTIN